MTLVRAWSRLLAVPSGATARREPDDESLVEASRERVACGLFPRDRLVSGVLAVLFLAAAAPLALVPASERLPSLPTAILLLAAYALVTRVAFEVGTGTVVASQLVLVPMLFVLPTGIVPLCVAAGLLASSAPELLRGDARLERMLVLALVSSWHAVGPALVLVLGGEGPPSIDRWPIYAAALLAQFSFDLVSTAVRDRLVFGVSPRAELRTIGLVYLVDTGLAPVGLATALATQETAYAFVLVLPLVGLLTVFARERKARIDHAIELSGAYRGTAFLLGDVVEADDAYTGSHSRDVVSLCLAVADEFGLDARKRRNAEFAALLHDVGKIRIPSEIIKKPGPLTAEERALIDTHTIEGERLLERVGGLLGEVGRIVRSCHERWDGRGYPDGLAGEEIPLVARIVACCDAFNAMTTTRSYRAALPLETAIAELEANSGTQFDPAVVDALVGIVGQDASETARETPCPAGAPLQLVH